MEGAIGREVPRGKKDTWNENPGRKKREFLAKNNIPYVAFHHRFRPEVNNADDDCSSSDVMQEP